jgi:cullin 1
MRAFRVEVFDAHKEQLMSMVSQEVNKEREGGTIDRGAIRQVVEMFLTMSVLGAGEGDVYRYVDDMVKLASKKTAATESPSYIADFETPFLQHTREFYERQMAQWIAADDPKHYVHMVDAAFRAESERVLALMHKSTLPKLFALMDDVLIATALEPLLKRPEAGLEHAMREGDTEEVALFYRVATRLPSTMTAFHEVLQCTIIAQADALYTARTTAYKVQWEEAQTKKPDTPASVPEHDEELIKPVTDMVQYFSDTLRNALKDHTGQARPESADPIRRGLRHLCCMELRVGLATRTVAEMVAAFMDRTLRNKRLTLEAADAQLRAACKCYDYITDKDTFLQWYRVLLANRLLGFPVGETGVSTELEGDVITQLKLITENQATSHLETMVKDAQSDYREVWGGMAEGAQAAMDGTVLCTAALWPQVPQFPKFNPPEEMQCLWSGLVAAYSSCPQGSGRKLVCEWSRGRMVLSWSVGGKSLRLKMHTLQGAICLAFNALAGPVTVSRLCEALGLEADTVKRAVSPLIYAKNGCGPAAFVLRNVTAAETKRKKKSVKESDVLEVADAAPKKAVREVAIKYVDLEASARKEAVDAAVHLGRDRVMDAILVRIMKARKHMAQAELVAEAVRGLSHMFQPQPRDLKRQIEALIEREYLERDEEDTRRLRYLA